MPLEKGRQPGDRRGVIRAYEETQEPEQKGKHVDVTVGGVPEPKPAPEPVETPVLEETGFRAGGGRVEPVSRVEGTGLSGLVRQYWELLQRKIRGNK